MKYPIGTQVIVSEGSGYESNKTGVIIDPKAVPMRKDGSGIPEIRGYYDRVDWRAQAALRMDEGYIYTMFWNRLKIRQAG